MAEQSRIVELTQKLIRANSENPGGTEKAVAEIVKKELIECGFEVKTYEFEKARKNVVGVLKGTSSEKSLLLTPHLDTVPAGTGWKHNPFAAEIVDNKIYGRGAADCKCNVAICLEAARQIRERGIKLDYDLIIAATADEEKGSQLGLIPLLEKQIITPTHALVMDHDRFKIVIMQKGVLRLNAIIFGKKAHGAYPWKGENAIEKAAEIIQNLKTHNFKYAPHPLVRPPTINIGLIKGGTAENIVADECEFTIDMRFLPGMEINKILCEIKEIMEKTTKSYRLTETRSQPAYEIDRNNLLVKLLESAIKKNGITPKVEGSEGATTMVFFQKYGIPAISFGIGPDMAHQTDEYVEIDALNKGTEVLLEFLRTF